MSQSFLRAVFDSVGEAVFVVRAGGRKILFCNTAVQAIFGYEPQELIGGTTRVLHVDDAAFAEFSRRSRQALEAGSPFHGRYQMRRRDGTLIHTEHTVLMMFGGAGGERGVVSVVRDVSEQHAAEQALRASELRLQELAGELFRAEERERASLVSEIHNELGQDFTAIKIGLDRLKQRIGGQSGETDEILGYTEKAVQNGLETVRRVATGLRPPLLDHLGLFETIRAHVEAFAAREQCEHELVLDAATYRPDAERDIMIFRVLQEALTNVSRHAQARHLRVECRAEPTGIVLEVVDDGRGMPESIFRNPRSVGLASMYERALTLAGTLNISSAPGQGTRVRLSVPAGD